MIEPAGPGAAAIAVMWWVLLAVMTVVFVLVITALGIAMFRRHDDAHPTAPGTGSAARERRRVVAVLVAGAGIPALILVGIFGYTVAMLDAVGPSTPAGELTVVVTGKQFWWDVRYTLPGGDTVRTANEIHVPVGGRVTLLLESDDVIHSLWIPRLHGKTDMIPGRTNEMWIEADQPGVYRGQCAEYCGAQHAWMALLVVAEPEREFRAWLERQRRPAAPLPPPPGASEELAEPGPPVPAGDSVATVERAARLRQGRDVYLDPEHRCTSCHVIRGVNQRVVSPGERQVDGPDLTHMASRRVMAGGRLRTNRGNMGGWLANPQVLKPGNLMPRIPLEPAELNALVDYMMSLR
jgi:cytochrome c oxidase subunit 2